MKNIGFTRSLLALAFVLGLSMSAIADTIRLKDGSVIRGQIVSFRDQQFTVLIGSGARGGGRRSRITLYMEDVDSIEFEAAAAAGGAGSEATSSTGAANETAEANTSRTQPTRPTTAPVEPRPSTETTGGVTAGTAAPRPTTPPATTQTSPTFFQIPVRVRADNTSNGWTNSGLVVRRGQKLRVNATGRVSLGQGRFATPIGLPRITDDAKLMRNEPTGGLIAVIGDDNDEFIFIGGNREFTASRDGVLFLGINESNLNDNSGTYDTVIEAEAVSGSSGGGGSGGGAQ